MVFCFVFSECGSNYHHRCKNNVSNNCGVNAFQISQMLQEVYSMNPNTDKMDQYIFQVKDNWFPHLFVHRYSIDQGNNLGTYFFSINQATQLFM